MNEKIKAIDLSTDDFNPRILVSFFYAQGMSLPHGYRLPKRMVYDYELEYFVESEGAMFIDEKLYPVQKGDIVFRRPGQSTQGIMPYSCYLISFDLSGKSDKYPEYYDFCAEKVEQCQEYYYHQILDPIPNLFHPQSGEIYLSLFDRVLKEFINPSAASPLLNKAYIIQILCHLSQDVCNPLNHTLLQSPHGSKIKRVVEYIQTNLNNTLNLEILAELTGYSPNYFHRVFTDNVGITLNEYITKQRLEQAKNLLIRTNTPVYKIALECGFENIPYFTSLFKKHLGISPAGFRKKHSYVS